MLQYLLRTYIRNCRVQDKQQIAQNKLFYMTEQSVKMYARYKLE